MESTKKSFLNEAFTLIELLIVMAILGVLAVVVFVLVDPREKQAQANDTGRKTTVVQLGRAALTYYTSQGQFPSSATWAQDLVGVGELSTFPSGIQYILGGTSPCATFVQPGTDPTFCYNVDAINGAIVFSTAEADSNNGKCAVGAAYFVFSSADARGGTICSTGDPAPWVSGTQVYVD